MTTQSIATQDLTTVGKKILDAWFNDTIDIEKRIMSQLTVLLTNIKNEYDNTVDVFYGEIDTDRETDYYIESFFKLDKDNNVVKCYRVSTNSVRLVYESDMISITELVQDLSFDLDQHIKLPKYQKFLDYLEVNRYYYCNYDTESLSDMFARQAKILSDYVLTIDDLCLDMFIDTVTELPMISHNAIWIIQETATGNFVEFLFGNRATALQYLNEEYYGGTHRLVLTTLNCGDVDDYVILDNYEFDDDYETVSIAFRDGETDPALDVPDTDLFDNMQMYHR